MIKRVYRWETVDGRIFSSFEEATTHTSLLKKVAFLDKLKELEKLQAEEKRFVRNHWWFRDSEEKQAEFHRRIYARKLEIRHLVNSIKRLKNELGN